MKQARDVRYYESEKGRATRAAYSKRRYKTPGYLAARARYYSNASGAYGRWRELDEKRRAYGALLREERREKRRAEEEAWKEQEAAELQALMASGVPLEELLESAAARFERAIREDLERKSGPAGSRG